MSRYLASIVFLCVFVVAIFFSSCKKDENSYYSYNSGIDAAKDYVVGQQMMALLLNTYFKSISDSLLLETGRSNIDGAAVYLKDGNPDTLLIRYPVWGTNDGYGHWRSGDIKVCAEDGFFNPSADYRFRFIDFLYDKDTLRVDSLSVQYMEKDGPNDLFSVYSDTICQIFSDSSGVSKFWMNQSFLRIKDPSSVYYTLLDKFEISGSIEGVSRDGVHYQTKIVTDSTLLSQYNCSFLKQGPLSISFRDLPYDGTIHFSKADTCANQYVAELDGSPFPAPIYTHVW
jgi:hypothetical protein